MCVINHVVCNNVTEASNACECAVRQCESGELAWQIGQEARREVPRARVW